MWGIGKKDIKGEQSNREIVYKWGVQTAPHNENHYKTQSSHNIKPSNQPIKRDSKTIQINKAPNRKNSEQENTFGGKPINLPSCSLSFNAAYFTL